MTDNQGSGPENTLATLLRPQLSRLPEILRVGDIYSGIGGATLAARNLGLKVVYATEEDAIAREVYATNLGLQPQQQLPRLFDDVPALELLLVHLSCGDVATLEQKGSRYQEAARFVRVRRPLGIVLESPSDAGLEHIRDELGGLGYHVGQAKVGGRSVIAGTLSHVPLTWSNSAPKAEDCNGTASAILHSKGFPKGWWMPDADALAIDLATKAIPVPVVQVMLGQVIGAVWGGFW